MCTFTGTRHGWRPDKVFSNTSRCSIIGYEDIRHWGIVPRYVLSRRPWWPNLTQCTLNRGKINYNINSETALISAISTFLSMKGSYVIRYDHQPAAGTKETDTILGITLVMNLI